MRKDKSFQEIDYVFFLSPDEKDRLRVFALKKKREILEFVVQYEAFIQDDWHSIIRYDTSHGFAHKDLIFPDGRVDKQPLYFESYNLAFTSATLELKRYWKLYRENYERRMKG